MSASHQSVQPAGGCPSSQSHWKKCSGQQGPADWPQRFQADWWKAKADACQVTPWTACVLPLAPEGAYVPDTEATNSCGLPFPMGAMFQPLGWP